MKIIYSCLVEESLKRPIEGLLQKWKGNNPQLQSGEWTIEIQKILTRGYTSGITFLAAFGLVGQKRTTRVFKADYLENVHKEATAALRLSKTVAANFFCRIQNHPEQNYWEDENKKKYGIIEYEYAGAMGATEKVDTLLDYVSSQFKNLGAKKLHDIVDSISRALDDVIQGLKTKVYTRETQYNISGMDVYKKKLKHFNVELVESLMSNMPLELISFFNDPLSEYEKINFSLSIGLNTNYTSKYIHGDLNPTNILVYAGHDRIYGTLIDFLEMELKKEEGFTPYFWDFARLEGELLLSLFTKHLFTIEKAKSILPKLADSLFNMKPISNLNDEISPFSEILVNLRKSFFRTEGLELDISFNSTDVIRSFYYTLLVFYISVLNFKNNPLEASLALLMAKIIAKEIISVDSKWISEKIIKTDHKIKNKREKSNNKKKLVIGILLTMLIIGIAVFTIPYLKENNKITTLSKETNKMLTHFSIEKNIPEWMKYQFEKGKKLYSEGLFDKSIEVYKEIQHDHQKDIINNPLLFAILKNRLGNSYYKLALKNGKSAPKNLNLAVSSFKEALDIKIFKDNHPGDYASIENSIGMVYNELSKSQNKKDNLLKAINYFNNALKRISDKSQTIFSNINTNLGISHWRLSSIQNKNQNLNTAITFLEEAQKNIDSKNKPNEYIKIQYYFAKIYSDLSKENPKKYLKLAINAYKNVSEQKKVHNIHIFPFTDKYIGESYHELYKIENTKEHLENALKYIENAKLIMNKENYNSLTTILQEKLALFKEKNHKIGLQEFTKPDSLKGDDKKLKKEIDETKENIKKIEDKNIVETKLFVLNPGPLSIKITSINIKSADGVKSYDLSINVDPGKKELIFNTMTGKQFTWTVYVKPEGSLIEFEK